MENKHTIPAWELMAAARAVLGMHGLERVCQIGHKQLYKQMRNPDLGGEHARPLIDRVRQLVCDLEELGGGDTAHAILQFISHAAGYTCVPRIASDPTCDDVRAECLEDYPTLVQLHAAIRNRHATRAVQALFDKHVDEVRQTVTLYEREKGEP
jgi:DNA-binding transcriptional LysR family regulator